MMCNQPRIPPPLKILIFVKGRSAALVVRDPPDNAGDADSVPGSGRPPGGGNGNPLQCSCLGNPWTEEPGGLQSVGSQSWTGLSDYAPRVDIKTECLRAGILSGDCGSSITSPSLTPPLVHTQPHMPLVSTVQVEVTRIF